MRVYQLKVKGIDMMLEPVFASRKKAEEYIKNKYFNRKIVIKETSIEPSEFVYRILVNDQEGYELKEELYTNLDQAKKNAKAKNEKVVKENILKDSVKNIELFEI